MNSITFSELTEKQKQGQGLILVDVRKPSEFSKSSLMGSINIPFEELEEGLDMLLGKQIVLYCNAGGKSKRGVDVLKRLGEANVRYLEGGIAKTMH